MAMGVERGLLSFCWEPHCLMRLDPAQAAWQSYMGLLSIRTAGRAIACPSPPCALEMPLSREGSTSSPLKLTASLDALLLKALSIVKSVYINDIIIDIMIHMKELWTMMS